MLEVNVISVTLLPMAVGHQSHSVLLGPWDQCLGEHGMERAWICWVLNPKGSLKDGLFWGNAQYSLQSGPLAAKEQVPHGHPGQLCTHLDAASLAVVRIARALPSRRDYGKVSF